MTESNDQQHDFTRTRWACRRGMLELDLILLPFFEAHYQQMPPAQQVLFKRLLNEADPDLYNWLMGYGQPEDPELQAIVDVIRATKATTD